MKHLRAIAVAVLLASLAACSYDPNYFAQHCTVNAAGNIITCK